jgi:hypothetical protein
MENHESSDRFSQVTFQSSTGSKRKRIFLDDRCQRIICQVLWFLIVWQEMCIYSSPRPQGFGDASGCVASGTISVKEEKDAWSSGEPVDLVFEDLSS